MEISKREHTRLEDSKNQWKERAIDLAKKLRVEKESSRAVRNSRESWRKKYEELLNEIEEKKSLIHPN